MTRSRHALVSAAVILALFVTGCAKQPAVTQAAAPPPTGAPVAAAPAPPVAAAPEPAPPVVTARPAPKEFAPEPQLADIYFDFDKSAIRPDAAKVLEASAEWLNGHADRTLLIEGHCDERGTEAYNLALGDRRAHATRDFLVAYGVIARRINVISYGTEQPQCSEHNEECWSLNRRAHFVLKAE